VCTDDRDADDLFLFGMDWVARQAIVAGLKPTTAWSMGSLHPATRYGMDGDIGGLAPARRADIVLLNDALEPQCTWYGGELVVKNRKVTPILDQRALEALPLPPRCLPRRSSCPPRNSRSLPRSRRRPSPPTSSAPRRPASSSSTKRSPSPQARRNVVRSLRPTRSLLRYQSSSATANPALLPTACLQDFNLQAGAVASSVGHDAHNIILAGTNEADLQLALATVKKLRGGVCVVRNGKIIAQVALPVAGLISDSRATAVAKETTKLKTAWVAAGCTLPYMGFNLIPLSVIPEIRITDRGLVTVPDEAVAAV